jgi:hypothetical protein
MECRPPHGTLPTYLCIKASGESVDDRATDTVKSTGHGVTAAAELSPGVENSEDNLNRRLTLCGVNIDGNSSTIVNDTNSAVLQNGYLDVVAIPCEGFINGVIDDLIDQVVQSAGTGRTDIHSGTFAYGFETFENLNLACTVAAVIYGPVRL